jgi:hypothetical protein
VKYLIEDSVFIIFFELFIRGIIIIILISNAIQILYHEYEEIASTILINSIFINMNFQYLKFIKKKRIITFISRVWT